MAKIAPEDRCYVMQNLKIFVPEGLWDHLVYGGHEIESPAGYRGTAVEVNYPTGNLAGTLVYYPGVARKSLK